MPTVSQMNDIFKGTLTQQLRQDLFNLTRYCDLDKLFFHESAYIFILRIEVLCTRMLTQDVMSWQRYKVFSKSIQNRIIGRKSSCKMQLVQFPSFLGASQRKGVEGLKEPTDLQQRDYRRNLPCKEGSARGATEGFDLRKQPFLQLLTQKFQSTDLHFGKKLFLLRGFRKPEKNFPQ